MTQTRITGENPIISRGDRVVPLSRYNWLKQMNIEARIRERSHD